MGNAFSSFTNNTKPRTNKRNGERMKNLFTSMLAMAALVAALWVSPVQAAITGTVTLTVTFEGPSVTVASGGTHAAGTVAASSVNDFPVAVITNNGTVTQTYSLHVSDEGADWTVGPAVGLDVYVVNAMFSTADPGATFDANDDLTNGAVACNGTKFDNGTPAQSGVAVPTTESRNLWLQFIAPSSTTSLAEQTIVVTVTAVAD
jgi:hypothetical protein